MPARICRPRLAPGQSRAGHNFVCSRSKPTAWQCGAHDARVSKGVCSTQGTGCRPSTAGCHALSSASGEAAPSRDPHTPGPCTSAEPSKGIAGVHLCESGVLIPQRLFQRRHDAQRAAEAAIIRGVACIPAHRHVLLQGGMGNMWVHARPPPRIASLARHVRSMFIADVNSVRVRSQRCCVMAPAPAAAW